MTEQNVEDRSQNRILKKSLEYPNYAFDRPL